MAPRKKTTAQTPPDTGLLRWLMDVANIGIDRTQPHGRMSSRVRSRVLGLDGKNRGYAYLPDRPDRRPKIELDTRERGWERLTQTYRGITKTWIRRSGENTLIPDGVPIDRSWTPINEAFPQLRPRAIMPTSGVTWTSPCDRSAGGLQAGQTVEFMNTPQEQASGPGGQLELTIGATSHLVRYFLESLWCLQHPEPGDGGTHYHGHDCRHGSRHRPMLPWAAHGGAKLPPQYHKASARLDPQACREIQVCAQLMSRFRGPVRVQVTDDLELVFVSSTLPGIA